MKMSFKDLETAKNYLKELVDNNFLETKNVVGGDEVLFIRGVWEKVRVNKFGKLAWKMTNFEVVSGVVLKESYGQLKQQHTFSILLEDNERMLIKGRNLYKFLVFRKLWENEEERELALKEKSSRRKKAKKEIKERILSENTEDLLSDFLKLVGA